MRRAQCKHPACSNVCSGASVQAVCSTPTSQIPSPPACPSLTPQQVLCNYIWLKSPAVTSLIEVRTSWLRREDKNSGGGGGGGIASEPRCSRTVCHSTYENLFLRRHFDCVFPVTLIKTPKIPSRNEMSPDAELVATNAIEIPFTFHKLFSLAKRKSVVLKVLWTLFHMREPGCVATKCSTYQFRCQN